jgi:hypothetical protein
VLSLTSALDGGGWSTPRTGRFTPGKETVPEVQEDGWVLGPVWTGAENLVSTGIRSPDRLAVPNAPSRTTQKLKYVFFAVDTDSDTREIHTSLNGQKCEIW